METEEDPAVLFARIRKKALSMGITPDQLESLPSVENLKAPRWGVTKISRYTGKVMCCLAVFVAVVGVMFAVDWPIARQQWIQVWFDMQNMDISKEVCILEMQEIVLDVTRPPVDCDMCKYVSKVEKVSGITPEDFEAQYAYTGTPIVITDAMKNWTATSIFSFNFFKEIYSDDSPALDNIESNCQFFPYKTNFGSLGEVFNMSEDRAALKDGSEPWYIGWSNCDSSAANLLRQHYRKPYFLPRVAESSKTDWIFMGSPGYGAHMHIDNVAHPSWQAQVMGRKRWTLEPPPECYHVCMASFFDVTVEPGEVIVLDTNRWFHSTTIEGSDMSITIGSEYD